MSMTDDIRTFLAKGEATVPDVAKELGLTNKQASSTLARLVKNGEATKTGDAFALVTAEEAEKPAESADEDLIGDSPAPATDKAEEPVDEEVYYEFIDFPGNYSIVMAPFALEIAAAAGVPAKSENIKGSLTRRVSFGGSDMDAAKATKELVEAEALAAHEELKTWQKKNIEKRRGLTDMQKYLQHREQLAAFGHKVAKRVKKGGGIS